MPFTSRSYEPTGATVKPTTPETNALILTVDEDGLRTTLAVSKPIAHALCLGIIEGLADLDLFVLRDPEPVVAKLRDALTRYEKDAQGLTANELDDWAAQMAAERHGL